MIEKQTTIDRAFILSIVVSLFFHIINKGQGFIAWSVFLGILLIFHTRAWLFIRKSKHQQQLFITSSTLLILYSLLKPSFPYPLYSENVLSIFIKFTTNYQFQINGENYLKISLTIWIINLLTNITSVFLIKRKQH